MAVQNRPAEIVELDPDATAELPIIEFEDGGTATVEAQPEAGVATDVFPVQVVPAGVADLADSLREVEQRLERKIERVGTLETELSAAQLMLDRQRAELAEVHRTGSEREASLRAELSAVTQAHMDLQEQLTTLKNDLAESRTQLQSQHAALTESQQQSQQRAGQQRDLERDLAEMRRRSERQHEALTTWQGFRACNESMLAESEAQLLGVDARHAAALQQLQAESTRMRDELASAQQTAATEVAGLTQSLQEAGQGLQARAAELTAAAEHASELEAALAAGRNAHAEAVQQLAELRELEEKARLGAAQFDEHLQQIAALQAEISAATGRQRDTETQLRKANERVQRLEADAHASAAVLGNLQLNMQRLGRDDTGSRPALQPSPLLTPLRVLIRQEGGSDVVYPLGRRTGIGRTPDNDIQVDATWISRHHAVLLSSPDQCIVEDLNSTNGVLVNGRRVGRHILNDGDTVTVGKTEFRYQQRS
ncbi:MAG: FHA domain-containing protein [Pseudomonadota bacterium]